MSSEIARTWRSYPILALDFDGVIKESVEVKAAAFAQVFRRYGSAISHEVRHFHLSHGGMGRHEKIRRMLSLFVGVEPTSTLVDSLASDFGRLVEDAVIASPWVPGAERLVRSTVNEQVRILATGTPQAEIERILRRLGLEECFSYVFGTPTSKHGAIRMVLAERGIAPGDCLFIGDSAVDIESARLAEVDFCLRETPHLPEEVRLAVRWRVANFEGFQ